MDLWMISAIGGALLAAAVLSGVYLWWPSRGDPISRRDLGLALVAGSLVAFAVLFLQFLFDIRLHELDERRERRAERRALKSNLQLSLSLLETLRRIRLPGRDLSGLAFPEEDLTGADLSRADLRRTTFSGAVLVEARLARADLTRADLTYTNLQRATLTQANLQQADLTGARLEDADLRRASYDAGTQWPPAFAPPRCPRDRVCTVR